MPNVPLNLDTIAGLRDSFENALSDVAASLADATLGEDWLVVRGVPKLATSAAVRP